MASEGAKFPLHPAKGTFVGGKRKSFKTRSKKWKDEAARKNFIGNKAEGQGFADRRKKKVLYEYRKLLTKERKRKDGVTAGTAGLGQEGTREEDGGENERTKEQGQKRFKKKLAVTAFSKQQQEFKRKQAEKEQRIKEAEQRREERIKAAAKHNKERWRRHVQLGKVNRKGQPVMANRIEYLLNKIQKETSSA